MKKSLLFVACLVASFSNFAQDASPVVVPKGFKVQQIASDLGATRQIAITKKGEVYAKLSKLKEGKGIYHLVDTDKDGILDKKELFGDFPGTGVKIQNGYLYTSSNKGLYRFKLDANQQIIDKNAPEKIIDGLPDHGRDNAKPFVFDNSGESVYMTIGSWNDPCRIPGTGQGMSPCAILDSAGGVWKFKLNKLNQGFADGERYVTGLKNAVGIDWNTQTNTFFATGHGRGQFHDFYPQFYTPKMSQELPAEMLYEFPKAGLDAGWPYIYYDQKQQKKILAPEYGGDGKKTAGEKAIDPLVAFPAHLGPNSLHFYTGKMFPAKYKNGAFIAFHGQSPEFKKGYLVAFVSFKNGKPSGNWEIFADNFAGVDLVNPSGPIQHRPCGLAEGPDGSLYVCDDLNGSIFKITYKLGK
ncbi:MAG: hypothetical protein RJA76_132 [Bacteroidota bacterium]|jgi:glucose/arabinose dehydrogenase